MKQKTHKRKKRILQVALDIYERQVALPFEKKYIILKSNYLIKGTLSLHVQLFIYLKIETTLEFLKDVTDIFM